MEKHDTYIEKFIAERLPQSLPAIVVLNAPNPLDPTTPEGTWLKVEGWGSGSKHITYDLPGWDQIGEDDPYYVVNHANGVHVIRCNAEGLEIAAIYAGNVESIITDVVERARDEGVALDDWIDEEAA